MKVYVNYPQPHFTIHRNPSCKEVQKHKKEEQRTIAVNPENLGVVLSDFIQYRYPFKAEASYNDLWFEISLDNPDQEIGFVNIIQALIGQRHTPLRNAPIHNHC